MSNSNNALAVRSFLRIWDPISAALDEGAAADAGFDGGEFSGPACANICEREYDRALARVASRFGLTPRALDEAVQAYGYDQFSRLVGASQARAARVPA